jgi:hypothetical protein
MAIKNGDLIDADSVINNLVGTTFKSNAQLLYNSALIGFNSKLNVATGVPNLKNVKYDAMLTDTASSKIGIDYDSSDKLYKTLTLSDLQYYVVVDASAFSGTTGISAGVMRVGAGRWLIFDPAAATNAQELERAKVHQILWSTGVMAQFTSVTAIRVSDSNDVGFRGFKAVFTVPNNGSTQSGSSTGTFGTTSGNVVSSWSNLSCSSGFGSNSTSISWEVPAATTLNSVSLGSGSQSGSSNEIGLDLQADEKTNPAGCRCSYANNGSANNSGGGTAIIFTKGTLSFSNSGTMTHSLTDYYTTYSVPDTTQADAIATEVGNATLIFQTSSLPTITDCIATWNSTIDSDNTLTVSISADGTNYEEVTDATIHRFTDTGTNLYIKFVITRVDTAAVDKISEYAINYNIGAS